MIWLKLSRKKSDKLYHVKVYENGYFPDYDFWIRMQLGAEKASILKQLGLEEIPDVSLLTS